MLTLVLSLTLAASPGELFASEACSGADDEGIARCAQARAFVQKQKGKPCLVVFKTGRLLYYFRDGKPVERSIDLKDFDPHAPKSTLTKLRFPVPVGLSTNWDQPPPQYGTPEGEYTLCSSAKETKYTHFFAISYPGPKDVAEAVASRAYSGAALERIRASQRPGRCPDFFTKLGGLFGVHGAPTHAAAEYAANEAKDPEILQVTRSDWTLGCVAVENRVIRFLAKELRVGTPILIVR